VIGAGRPPGPTPRGPARADAAVALFAKAPVAGRVKTRLVPPLTPEEAARVARALLVATLETLVATLPVRWVLFLDGTADEELRALVTARGLTLRPQGEGDLGARLGAAFRALRAEGAARVIAVGADGPTLPPRLLGEAIDALLECDLVLGPTEDGGYYLVGTATSGDEIFRDIPWSTGSVLSTTLARAAESGRSVRLLPAWYDVDSVEDLRRLRDEVRRGPATAGLCALIDALEGRI
jgi:rSAM/selenodomain-associated transferase 1